MSTTAGSASGSPVDETLLHQVLRAAVETSPLPLAVVDAHRLVLVNGAFAALTDAKATWELAPVLESAPHEGSLAQLVCRLASSGSGAVPGVHLRCAADGRAFDVRLVALPGVGQQATAVWLQESSGDAELAASAAAARAWIEQHERLRVTGEMALGIAHDVHNTLGAIGLRMSVLQKDEAAMAAQGRNIEALHRILGEGSALVAKFKSLGQMPPPGAETQVADLGEVIAAAVEIAQSGLKMRAAETGVHVRMEMMVSPRLPPVTGMAEELCQLFVNLLINARDAMPEGGRVVISAEEEAGTGRVVVRVEDEGTGIPAAVLPRVFDSFYTTKGRAGTGMGLALARATMARIGGSIEAGNRDPGGAVFTLRFQPHAATLETGREIQNTP